MIVDVIPFFNELDLLELRLNHLWPIVDLTIIAEAPLTFSGLPKPLHFNENKSRFSKFNIHHAVVDSIPRNATDWDRDMYQKRKLFEFAAQLKPEIAIVSDLDEIPNVDCIEKFRALNIPTCAVSMDMLLFYFDRHDPIIQRFARITRDFSQVPARYSGSTLPYIESGWHCEYMGSRQTLLDKIAATAHAKEECGRDFYSKIERGVLDGLQRTSPYPVEKLPKVIQENIPHYLPMFSPEFRASHGH